MSESKTNNSFAASQIIAIEEKYNKLWKDYVELNKLYYKEGEKNDIKSKEILELKNELKESYADNNILQERIGVLEETIKVLKEDIEE